jgi:hypothetical protein
VLEVAADFSRGAGRARGGEELWGRVAAFGLEAAEFLGEAHPLEVMAVGGRPKSVLQSCSSQGGAGEVGVGVDAGADVAGDDRRAPMRSPRGFLDNSA